FPGAPLLIGNLLGRIHAKPLVPQQSGIGADHGKPPVFYATGSYIEIDTSKCPVLIFAHDSNSGKPASKVLSTAAWQEHDYATPLPSSHAFPPFHRSTALCFPDRSRFERVCSCPGS